MVLIPLFLSEVSAVPCKCHEICHIDVDLRPCENNAIMKPNKTAYRVSVTQGHNRSQLEGRRKTVSEGDDPVETDLMEIGGLKLDGS